MDNMQSTMIINACGDREWFLNHQLHRTDGPACEWANGSKFWYIDGLLHRTDGPAIEYSTGGRSWWWLHGQKYTFDKWLDLNTDLAHEQKVMMKLQYG
jgi:hypothetical protein